MLRSVRVLGNTDRYLAPRSGGSGYLAEADDGTRVLLDCGGGIADALGDERFDALVLSHFHHDHVLDLMRLKDSLPEGLPIIIPPGEAHRFDELGRAFAFRGTFQSPGPVHEARPDAPLRVGGLELRFAPTRHSAPSFATRIEGFVYASDTAPCDTLEALARGCDVLLMHTLLPRIGEGTSHAARHVTAESASMLAVRAGAKRLVLSHRFHESRDEEMLAAARAHHPRVELARTGSIFDMRDEHG